MVHKSQGMTQKIVIGLPSKNIFSSGLSYLAVSRVEALAYIEGVAFLMTHERVFFGNLLSWLEIERSMQVSNLLS